MRKNKTHALVLTLITFTSVLFGLGSIAANTNMNFGVTSEVNDENGNLRISASLVVDSNVTEIFRLFETVNITVDAKWISPAANISIQIPYVNNTVYSYNMTWIRDDIFSYNYTPREDAPCNLQQIKFQVYDSLNSLVEVDNDYINIIVLPNCDATLNNNTFYNGDLLSATLTPSIISNATYGWNKWNVSIVNDTFHDLFTIEGDNINSFSFTINDSFDNLNGYYHVKVRLYNDNQLKGFEYYTFQVINHAPEIVESTISFASDSIFRSESCTLTLNATDLEDNATDLSVAIFVKSPDGQSIVYQSAAITNNGDGTFTGTIPTYSYSNTGVYTVEIRARDQQGDWSSISYATFTVKNNPPVINSYSINGYSASQSISILYGQNLVFSFNVTDVEGIAYVKVALIDENHQWVNITQSYEIDVEITLRTTQLITGVWYIYAFVIDNDGKMTGLGNDYTSAPQAIVIIPDVLSAVLPWIALIMGIIIGIVAGVGMGYYRMKSKEGEPQRIKTKKKTPTQKKPAQKKKAESEPKPEPKPEPASKEAQDKPKVYDKKEPEKKPPQRKIKRKL